MLTTNELEQFKKRGISPEKALWQINQFVHGVKPIKLVAPASISRGIHIIDDTEKYIKIFDSSKKKYTKFVPASGAASRMFKSLFEFRDAFYRNKQTDIEQFPDVLKFFNKIHQFAFYKELNLQCEAKGASVDILIREKKYDIVLNNLLDNSGLSYENLPKGLLTFHRYPDGEVRTAFEEHLSEGAQYSKSSDNTVNIHFTVSPEHIEAFKYLSKKVLPMYEEKYAVKYTISYSMQKPSTDTLAVTPENKPFVDSDGQILFRPGGHGALIENLNLIDSDLIFIKNIDNVVPESKMKTTIEYKKALAGILLETQQKIFHLVKQLQESPSPDIVAVASELLQKKFNLSGPCVSGDLSDKLVINKIISRLNRPLRVCGVVKNVGETGGGPFFAEDESGCVSLQIVESSQVDSNNRQQMEILKSSSHFNPVDIVCGVKDYLGRKFNLPDFVDSNTCFIAEKSKSGKKLQALELPGLWNGAMAGWNTIFVEVPIITFNPVKTVNDLSSDAHQ
jgi:hypothetical protein